MSAAPILGGDGRPTGAVFVIDDVSNALRAKQVERYRYDVLELAANDAPIERIFARLVEGVEYGIPGAACTISLLRGGRLFHASGSEHVARNS